ncbi:MAG: diacylglycerol kinase family protein, partial [Candidatus Competibacterales bacterium]|nr:diacylglycerol kinase family protein [Candidatus Competibacterales bacterium]
MTDKAGTIRDLLQPVVTAMGYELFGVIWQGGRRRGEIESALQDAGVDHEISVTEGPNHATDLARTAVRDGFSPVLSAGG